MRKMLLAAMLLTGLYGSAQVNMLFNTRVAGRDMRGLSMVQFINNTTSLYQGYLEVEVRELAHNRVVVKIVVPAVSVAPGSNILPAAKFTGGTVFYAPTAEGNYVKQTGMMPEGDLEYCFKYTASTKDSPGEVFENCFTGINIISSPMQLVSPANGQQSCEKRPRFSWQPPLPLTPGTVYTLRVVKIQPGQSPAEAVLVNTPLIYQINIRGFMMAYPAGVADLKEDQRYAWQVTADDRGRQTLSEVWDFQVQCTHDEKSEGSYRELTPSDNGSFLSTGPALRFALYNPYTAGALQYKITSLAKAGKEMKGLPKVDLQKGQNNILVDLNAIPGMEEEEEYQLEVMLPDGKKIAVRFKYDQHD